MKTSSKLILRWSLELGSLNINADMLSCSAFLNEPTKEDLADFRQDLHKVAQEQEYEKQILAVNHQKVSKISMLSTPLKLDINRQQIELA